MHLYLVARVVAGHVAFATVDTHLWIDEGLHLFRVVQILVGANMLQRSGNHILCREERQGLNGKKNSRGISKKQFERQRSVLKLA